MVMERTRTCRCGARYCSATFAALRPVRVLALSELAPLVVSWPENTVVDVRACAGCSAPIAALAKVACGATA